MEAIDKNMALKVDVSIKRIRRSEDLTNAEALRILKELAGRRELTEDQRRTLDYLEKAAKQGGREAVRRLMEQFGFARVTAIQLVNLAPETPEMLKALLSHLDRRDFSEADIREMLGILQGQ